MADIRVKDLDEASVPGDDYYLLTDSATDGVKKVKTTNVVVPVASGVSGLGTGVAAFLATPSSANLASALTDETGSGAAVFATSPTLVTPALGAASATSVNKVAITAPATGSTLTIADGKTLTASDDADVSGTNTGDQTITLTGDVTGTGTGSFAVTIGATKVTSAMLNSDVFSTAHSWGGTQTFTAPVLGTPASGVATNLTGTASGLTAGNVTTNANLTGDVTSSGNATTIGATKVTSAMLNADVFSSIHTWGAVQTFSAAPIVPTQSPSDNSTKAASTAYVDAQVSGGVSGVSSLNGKTGALVLNVPPLGRITLATGVPVMSTSQAGKTTVYYTPYCGNIVPIYDGTNMVPTVFTELSQATTDTTKSPAAVAATKIYDLFVWNDSGTIRCTRGPAWTNATTRGYTLTMVGGILLNTSAITNGPAASRGTWVGTIASNASSTIDFIFGTSGSGGVAAVFNVWSAYNRVTIGTRIVDTGTSYTYTSSTVRQARASAGMQVSFVVGAQEDSASAIYQNTNQNVAASGASTRVGVGYDATNAFSNNAIAAYGNASIGTGVAPFQVTPAPGTHFFAAVENSDNTNANTFNLGGASSVNGFSAELRM